MDNFILAAITSEIEPELIGRVLLRVSMAGADLRLDFGLGNRRSLVVSLDPASPAIYISSGTRLENDPASPSAQPFLALLHKQLVGAALVAFSKDPSDRLLRFAFEPYDPTGNRRARSLVFALTGRTANAYLTDGDSNIDAALRDLAGTTIGDKIDLIPRTDQYDEYVERLNPGLTRDEILSGFFGAESMFGPQLEREFVARSNDQPPSEAFESLLTDLLKKRARPLIYARHPLDEMGSRPVTMKTDLLLSHIELVQAARLQRYEFDSLSEAADRYFRARIEARAFLAEFGALQQLLSAEVKRHNTLIQALEIDKTRFDDPDRLKRFGDLLLANLTTGKVKGRSARVVDYYDPDQRETEIELEEGVTMQQAAASYFARYQKAKRGMKAVTSRLEELRAKLDPLNTLLNELRADPTGPTVARIRVSAERLLGRKGRKPGDKTKERKNRGATIGRRFLSSDGFEILVGRKDRDNDQLTFRVAQSLDVFLHAADYPGSHVIIRNPNRKPVPQQTIQEAAELAAFFSQAKSQGKAAVHYTEKKAVTKPPRAKPGLVRLSSFKTIMVQPRCVLERIE